jgi:processing peptidase subunit alpha
MYCVDVLTENLEAAMHLLAEAVLMPRLSPDELEEGRMVMELMKNEMPADTLSKEAVQMAAYDGPLSNRHFCGPEDAAAIDTSMLQSFRAKHFTGSNCFVAGAGVEHSSFVRLVEKTFGNMPKTPAQPISSSSSGSALSSSTYRGGLVLNERHLQEPFVKVAVAFQVDGWHSDNIVATCVLHQLLGGGSSFSAGGPGKGMYTRLYREILNRYYWVEGAECFISVNDESGLFGIDATCASENAQSMIRVVVDQLARLAFEEVSSEELNRAKNMLKSMMFMQLESRLVLCEDIVRQLVTYARRDPPELLAKKIDDVSAQDLLELARKMVSTKVSVGAVGHDLKTIPTYDAIDAFVGSYLEDMTKSHSN